MDAMQRKYVMTADCPTHHAAVVQSLETKPYPGQRLWIYRRAAKTCADCGLYIYGAWGRALADSQGQRKAAR